MVRVMSTKNTVHEPWVVKKETSHNVPISRKRLIGQLRKLGWPIPDQASMEITTGANIPDTLHFSWTTQTDDEITFPAPGETDQ